MPPEPMGVLTPVGWTVFTRMWCAANSAANAFAIPRMANLLVV